MKKNWRVRIRVSFLVLWLCSLTTSVYATGPETLGSEAGENRPALDVPAAELKNTEDGNASGKMPASSTDFLNSDSPLSSGALVTTVNSMSDGRHVLNDGSFKNGDTLTLERQPSEQEVGAIVDNILSQMAGAGLEEDLSQALTYISSGDYAGLVDFQNKNPEILNQLSDSLQEISDSMAVSGATSGAVTGSGQVSGTTTGSTASSESSIVKGYVDRWLVEVNQVLENRSELQQGVGKPGPSIEAVAKLYKPIAERISEVTQNLKDASRISKDHEGQGPSSGNPLKNFSAKARKFILDSFDQAQANLANEMLSSPLETTAFAAEAVTVQAFPTALDQTGVRKMTLTELYVKSQQYRVVDSVYIGKGFIYAQKMLHPPANLHPYLKWLLYTRNLTPRMVEHYLATRESVAAIYAQAKAGQGNIRYKGKVYGAFLPFAETAAGNYELVKPASGE